LTQDGSTNPAPPVLRALALAAAAGTLVMIALGALVTSLDAGLSIPDGVSNHGAVVPAEQLRSGYVTPEGREYSGGEVLTELQHRYVGWPLGVTILALAVAATRVKASPMVRRLAWAAALVVALQGAVGALGVELKQPAVLVIPHAFLAQALLALTVSLAVLTRRPSRDGSRLGSFRGAGALHAGLVALTGLTFAQTLLGAAFRHANSGLALAAHVALALLLVLLTAWAATRAQDARTADPALPRAAALQGALLMAQVFLGFLAWLFRVPKNSDLERGAASIVIPTLHVLTGALLLAGFVALTWRVRALARSGASVKPTGAPAPPREAVLTP
jgi:heme A synthase